MIWIRGLLTELGITVQNATMLFCYNNVAMQIFRNLMFYERNKHIKIECHFVREKQLRIVQLVQINNMELIADLLTKSLGTNIISLSAATIWGANRV